jgi:hypothetical protein
MLAAAGGLGLVAATFFILATRAMLNQDAQALENLRPLVRVFTLGVLIASFATNALARAKPRT